MPTIDFYPQPGMDHGDLKVLKSREKKVVTMDIGPFRAKETVLYGSDGAVYHSGQLRSLTPHRCTYGYDVLVTVGRALFVDCHSEQQIIEDLSRKNIFISARQIGYLGRKFIAYLAIAHQQSRQRLKKLLTLRGGYILHLDGTCEGDSPHLFTGIDGIAQIVLDNIKLPSEKAELLIPFFDQIKQQYGEPIALVHDMGYGILSAVKAVFSGVADFICHFHFLRDIGKDLFDKDYATIRNRLKKHGIRSLLRRKAKELGKFIENDSEAVCSLASGIENGFVDFTEKVSASAACTMIHWTFDRSELNGYGYPFDCPHLVFYQRLKKLYALITSQGIKDRALLRLWRLLTKVMEDQQLKKAASQMQKNVQTFERLREALCIAAANEKKGLNDDGQDVNIKSIEEKVKQFRNGVASEGKGYENMIKQIDKYWDKLFADPITVETPTGPIIIQPQRTNNILERFFRDFKRDSRKRSGRISLNRTLRFMLTDTPLVKNLDNPQYLEIILDGCRDLEQRFERIDNRLVIEKLKIEQREQQGISLKMKKMVELPDLPERLSALLTHQQY